MMKHTCCIAPLLLRSERMQSRRMMIARIPHATTIPSTQRIFILRGIGSPSSPSSSSSASASTTVRTTGARAGAAPAARAIAACTAGASPITWWTKHWHDGESSV